MWMMMIYWVKGAKNGKTKTSQIKTEISPHDSARIWSRALSLFPKWVLILNVILTHSYKCDVVVILAISNTFGLGWMISASSLSQAKILRERVGLRPHRPCARSVKSKNHIFEMAIFWLLLYESSTLKLYTELSSSIFQSLSVSQWVRASSVYKGINALY